ncbi:MAG: TlpA disulfide reductase family protein [Actinomycetota bacterium]
MVQAGGFGALVIVAVAVLVPKGASSDYRPAGQPRRVPTSQLAPVSADEFGGILVGQHGRPVVVNVWASWCAPCRAEMPLLDKAAGEYADRITFIGVASEDTQSAAASFLDELGIDYPNVFDESCGVRAAVGLRGFPTTYFFDRDGGTRGVVVGGITEQRLAAQLQDLLR